MMVIIGSWHRRRSLSRLEPLFLDYFFLTLFLEYLGLSLFLEYLGLSLFLDLENRLDGLPMGI